MNPSIITRPRASNIQITNYASGLVKKLEDEIYESDYAYPVNWINSLAGNTRLVWKFVSVIFDGEEQQLMGYAINSAISHMMTCRTKGQYSTNPEVMQLIRDNIIAIIRDKRGRAGDMTDFARLTQSERKLQRVLEETIYDAIDREIEDILASYETQIGRVTPRGKIDPDLVHRITRAADYAVLEVDGFIVNLGTKTNDNLGASSYVTAVIGSYDGDQLLTSLRNIMITRLREIIPWWKPGLNDRLQYDPSMSPADCSKVITDITTMLAFRRSEHGSEDKIGGPW